jgi:hypothetical protein
MWGFFLRPGWIGAKAIALEDARHRFGEIFIKECADTGLGAAFTPMIDDAFAGQMTGPEVTGFGAAVAGRKVADGRFVDLKIAALAMFILDFTVNAGEPIGGEPCPIAERFAM